MGCSVVLLGDQLPMPSQQGLRGDNAGDLGKSLSSQRFGLNGQPPALIVIEAHSLATELFSQHPILFAEIFNDLQLAVVHPPGDGDQQKLEWVEHSLHIQDPLSCPSNRSSETSHLHADPVFGPYGIRSISPAVPRLLAIFGLPTWAQAATSHDSAHAAYAWQRRRLPPPF